VAFGGFCSFRVIFVDVPFCEEQPTNVIARFDCFEPGGFDWIPANCMHPLNCFLDRWEVVDTVGLLEIFLGMFCWSPWLTIASVLHGWYPIAPIFVSLANENCRALACDEDVLLFVDRDTFLGENGYIAIVGHFPTLMSEVGGIVECVCLCCCFWRVMGMGVRLHIYLCTLCHLPCLILGRYSEYR
jgi:hypothetical protein